MSYGRKWDVDKPRSGALVESDRLSVTCDASDPVDGAGALQEFADECDINNIMARFQRSGALEWASKYEPQYGDVTGLSFQRAQDVILAAQQMFDDLPSSVRNRFANDPGAFLDFVHDEKNRDEMQRLGLLKEALAPVVVGAAATPLPA